MSKRVLDVGNCGPDHGSIKTLVARHFDADAVQADDHVSAVAELEKGSFDLVLVNRLMDVDGSSGIEIVKSIVEQFGQTPVMMITNFAEHQQAAISAGAVPGFGKAQLDSPATVQLLQTYLS